MEIASKKIISVIVPVYKAEDYLGRCIDSILAQTFKDWELLLIDDGSPDRSSDICEEYAKKDTRIKVFHKKNSGVSSARNLGLDNVQGKYVTFLDADDCLYPNALEAFVSSMEQNKLDLVQCHYNREYGEGQILGNDSKIETPSLYVNKRFLCVCVWGGGYRYSIIEQHHLRFDENIRLGEDQIFIFKFLQYAARVQHISQVLYFYRDNEASAVHNPRKDYLIDSIKAFQSLKKDISLVSGLCDKQILEFFIFLSLSNQTSIKEIKTLLRDTELQDSRFCTPKVKVIYYLYKLSLPLSVLLIRLLSKLFISVKAIRSRSK